MIDLPVICRQNLDSIIVKDGLDDHVHIAVRASYGELRVSVRIDDVHFLDTPNSVDSAIKKALHLLRMTVEGTFKAATFAAEEAVRASKPGPVTKPAVPSDFDDGKEGDPQAIWEARLRHLNEPDRLYVDDIEKRLIALVIDRPLKRRLRAGVGWQIGSKTFLYVSDAIEVPRAEIDTMIRTALQCEDNDFLPPLPAGEGPK